LKETDHWQQSIVGFSEI